MKIAVGLSTHDCLDIGSRVEQALASFADKDTWFTTRDCIIATHWTTLLPHLIPYTYVWKDLRLDLTSCTLVSMKELSRDIIVVSSSMSRCVDLRMSNEVIEICKSRLNQMKMLRADQVKDRAIQIWKEVRESTATQATTITTTTPPEKEEGQTKEEKEKRKQEKEEQKR